MTRKMDDVKVNRATLSYGFGISAGTNKRDNHNGEMCFILLL